MNSHKNLNILIIILFFLSISGGISCKQGDRELEDVLIFAKNNRRELEKVLKHYKGADSLKYQAARFLIINMKDHWYFHDNVLKSYRANFYKTVMQNNCTPDSALSILEKKYGNLDVDKLKIVYDPQIITADYLIKNIDYSFKIWKQQPWGKHINFQQFCEEILPYRIGHEPLENWKEQYYIKLLPVLNVIKAKKIVDPVEACDTLYKFITKIAWIQYASNPIPQMGAINLLKSKIGSCEDRSDFATYAMRSMGIPGGVDLVLQYPNRMLAHSWNYVTDTLGKCVPYDLYENEPNVAPDFIWKKGRVYRKCYGVQQNSLPVVYPEAEIPQPLKNVFIKDVSENYSNGTAITLSTDSKNKVIFLNTFNNKTWFPISWSKVVNGKVVFKYVEKDIVYLPCDYKDSIFTPVSYPFMVNSAGNVHFFKPDLKKKQSLELYRKYPVQPWWVWYKNRAIGGQFQVSNASTFADKKTILTIKEDPGMQWHQFNVSLKDKYRYFRYLSADSGYNDMAEVELLSSTGVSLSGKVIGTAGSYGNDPKYAKESVFDGDPVSVFDANTPNGAWSGLDLGRPNAIGKVNFIFRNDDNNVRKDDYYELFYWNKEWISLGAKTATENKLTFDACPVNALFLLRDQTRGTEERIFSYADHKQVWW